MRPFILALALVLPSCAAYRQELSRFDGAPMEAAETERAKMECSAAGTAAAAGVGWQGPGFAGAVAQGMNQAQAQQAAYMSCMARNGIRITMVKEEPKS